MACLLDWFGSLVTADNIQYITELQLVCVCVCVGGGVFVPTQSPVSQRDVATGLFIV